MFGTHVLMCMCTMCVHVPLSVGHGPDCIMAEVWECKTPTDIFLTCLSAVYWCLPLYLLPPGKSSANTFILSFVVVVAFRYLKFGVSKLLGRYTQFHSGPSAMENKSLSPHESYLSKHQLSVTNILPERSPCAWQILFLHNLIC